MWLCSCKNSKCILFDLHIDSKYNSRHIYQNQGTLHVHVYRSHWIKIHPITTVRMISPMTERIAAASAGKQQWWHEYEDHVSLSLSINNCERYWYGFEFAFGHVSDTCTWSARHIPRDGPATFDDCVSGRASPCSAFGSAPSCCVPAHINFGNTNECLTNATTARPFLSMYWPGFCSIRKASAATFVYVTQWKGACTDVLVAGHAVYVTQWKGACTDLLCCFCSNKNLPEHCEHPPQTFHLHFLPQLFGLGRHHFLHSVTIAKKTNERAGDNIQDKSFNS